MADIQVCESISPLTNFTSWNLSSSKLKMLTESTVNPFAKRESHSKQQLLVYKVLTILTWILVVIVSVACSFKSEDRRTIWGQNKAHPTPFSLNPFITDIYWRVLNPIR